jgi:hypothetical protein
MEEDVVVLFAHDGGEGKVVKGAPYQAQAVTEIAQTLADGNKIVRKNTSSVARDSEGRTRREGSLAALGPFGGGDKPPRHVFIHDPVAGVAYVLEPDEKVARKLPKPGEGPDHMHGEPGMRGPRPGMGPGGMGPGMKDKDGNRFFNKALPKGEPEALGSQTIDGVEAEGTRRRFTIAAGEIGNEKAIEVVSERWYSKELQTVVMSRHSDPRFGETTYRLTTVTRGEPDRALFEVPADYTVKDGPPEHMRHRELRDKDKP